MIAAVRLEQSSWAGRLADVLAGHAFWADDRQVAELAAAGLAAVAPPNTPAPPPEPPWTASATPGFGRGTSNCSH